MYNAKPTTRFTAVALQIIFLLYQGSTSAQENPAIAILFPDEQPQRYSEPTTNKTLGPPSVENLLPLQSSGANETTTLDPNYITDDYLYPDYDEITPSIRKCKCQATELLDNGQCVENPMLVERAKTLNVTVEDLICPLNMTLVTLPLTSFKLLFTGDIAIISANLSRPLSEHCIEHIYDENRGVTAEAKICLSPPVFPRCCSQNQELKVRNSAAQSIECIHNLLPIVNNTFEPTVLIDQVPITWNSMTIQNVPIKCGLDFNLTSSVLGLESGDHLSYDQDGIILRWMTPNNREKIFYSDQFCLSETNGIYESHFCFKNPLHIHRKMCDGKVCVRKCCPESEIFLSQSGCANINVTEEWLPTVHSKETKLPYMNTNFSFTKVYGEPICSNYYPLSSRDPPVTLLDSGELLILAFSHTYTSSQYCLDNVMNNNGSIEKMTLACFPEFEEPTCMWQNTLKLIALGLSCIFIIATLFVYLSVAEIRTRLPSKCVISQSFAVMMSYLSLIVLTALERRGTTNFCIVIGKKTI